MKIGFTCSAFDLLHAGHIQMLRDAKSVCDYLISNSIDKSRLTYKGYGDTRPINDNNTKQNRAKNRRTEFKVIET